MKDQKVVGIAFIQDNKLLVVQSKKSSKTETYTLIGGGVEEKESLVDAAIREVSEEIHNGFTIKPEELEFVMSKKERAASDPNKFIEMNIFIAHKLIDVQLIPNEEILKYHWYSVGDNLNVSNSIKDFLDYALVNQILVNEIKSRSQI